MAEQTRADVVAGYFKGLRELELRPASKLPSPACDHLTNREAKEGCKANMEYFFTVKAQEVPGFRIPKIDIVIPKGFEASDEIDNVFGGDRDDGSDDTDDSDGHSGLWDWNLDDLDDGE
jgi:hypothetical protein